MPIHETHPTRLSLRIRLALSVLALAAAVAGVLASATVAGAAPSGSSARNAAHAAAWFHDPLSAAQRSAEIPIPSEPASVAGEPKFTVAADRTASGAIAVPAQWANHETLESPEALLLDGSALFAFNSSQPTETARNDISKLSASMKLVTSVRCEGYADFGGPASNEQQLSAQRAEAICALVKADGKDINTSSVGYGPNRPVVVGGVPNDRAANRRVVIVVTASVQPPKRPRLMGAAAANDSAVLTFHSHHASGRSAITGYEYSLDGARWRALKAYGKQPLHATLAGLSDGHTYTVRLRALNIAGASSPSLPMQVTPQAPPVPPAPLPSTPVPSPSTPPAEAPKGPVTPPATVPGAPTLLISKAEGEEEVGFEFAAPSEDGGSPITEYQYSLDGGSTWSVAPVTGSGPYSVAVTGLDPETTYIVEVRAVNAAGAGAPSTSDEVTTEAAISAPNAPTIVGGTVEEDWDAGEFIVYLEFEPPTSDGGLPVLGYEYEQEYEGVALAFQPLVYSAGSPDTSTIETGVPMCGYHGPEGEYTYRIRAYNEIGDSPVSNEYTLDLESGC
ncbi:MAG TPA: fibronectin type III domain-containing protein [Solirubrobacteraceae bacterium]|jgi:outer membrane protein OmpA-like peptidoglycan-associated protein